MTTCRSSGDGEKSASSPQQASESNQPVSLPGVDSSQLTAREKLQWSNHVTTLLAPCEDATSTIAECVEEKKDCSACVPAAQYLLRQVQQGKTPGQTEAAYDGRFSPKSKQQIEVGDAPVKGPPSAPITLIEFADFECPACRAASPVLDEVLQAQGDVRLVFKNFPLNMHPNAEVAARAAVAAGRQGKFWEMHHALFSSPPPLTPSAITEMAKKIELDMAQFDADLRSEKVADSVLSDRKQGEDAKISSTPSLFINGRAFNYQGDMKTELLEWIELERQLMGEESASAAKAPTASDKGAAAGHKLDPTAAEKAKSEAHK